MSVCTRDRTVGVCVCVCACVYVSVRVHTVVALRVGPVVPEVGVLLEVLPDACGPHSGTLEVHSNKVRYTQLGWYRKDLNRFTHAAL